MSKKIIAVVKLALTAGKATPAPPIGPALGQYGVNIVMFCREYNAQTIGKLGSVIPVEITVYEDKSFTFILKTSPASVLLAQAVGVSRGSGQPNKILIGSISKQQLQAIAQTKLQDLNTLSIEKAMRIVEGTAKNMGITIY